VTTTNKWLLISKSHGDSNRCTPCRKNLTKMSHTLPTPVHVRPVYASCGQSLYMATFHESSTELSRHTAPKKKGSQHNPQRTANRSTAPYPASLPSQPMKQWGAKPSIYQRPATRFTGSISPVCDQYVQYCSQGLTHQSLTDIGGGYNLGGASFPRTTP
jgi:hypothetical protein